MHYYYRSQWMTEEEMEAIWKREYQELEKKWKKEDEEREALWKKEDEEFERYWRKRFIGHYIQLALSIIALLLSFGVLAF